MQHENIIIVNDNDECIGSMDKMAVHQTGILHRAFSILLVDGEGNMLIQKRSASKYHSPLLWANACCSHQREGETLEEAAHRRLLEELGIGGINLNEVFVLRYFCRFDNSLIENEIDHVYLGNCKSMPVQYNKDEIAQLAWVNLDMLMKNTHLEDVYAYWFKLIIEKLASIALR